MSGQKVDGVAGKSGKKKKTHTHDIIKHNARVVRGGVCAGSGVQMMWWGGNKKYIKKKYSFFREVSFLTGN